MKKIIQLSALSFIIVISLISVVFAQSFRSTIVGKVSDPSGAAVPGAKITVTQNGTNIARTATSNDSGEYVVAELQPGNYTVKIDVSGFKVAINTNVILETDETRRFDVNLDVGSVNETVTIDAEPPTLNTETPEKGEVIVQKQVVDLPLNGRDFTDLAKLVPGIYQRPSEDDQGQGLAAAGTRTDSTNFILDGISNRSDRNGAVGVNTSVDSIQEFKVSTSTYTAEFGKLAGAQISVVSKSGTNRFSGTAFEFLRNDVFDATNTFAPPDESKVLRRHQFGGTFAGPLPFFHFGEGGPVFDSGKDKTFFFTSFERTQQVRSNFAQGSAPNAAWRNGDFTALRGNGTNTGTCVPGSPVNTTASNPCNDDTNRITCVSRNPTTLAVTRVECPVLNVIPLTVNPLFPNILPASPIALQILNFLPTANVPGSLVDYRFSTLGDLKRNLISAKIDRKLTENNNFYFRIAADNRNEYTPGPAGRVSYPGFGRNVNYRQYSYAFSDTHSFTPTLINEFRLGYLTQNNKTVNENSDADYIGQFGIPGLPTGQTPELQGFPAIRIDGFPDTGDSANTPFNYIFNNFQVANSVTAIVGNHSLKFGVDISRPNYIENDIRNVRGDFRFRGRFTNPQNAVATGFRSFADFLYGIPDSTQRQLGAIEANLKAWQSAFFVQDTWRVARWLTLSLGVRYDYTPYLSEKDSRLSNFLPELGVSVCAGGTVTDPTLGLICRNTDGLELPGGLVKTDSNNLAPRFGFAIKPFNDDKTVIRGGAGIFYSTETINPARQQLANNYPYLFRETYSRSSTANILQITLDNPFNAVGNLQGVTTPQGIPTNAQTPEVYQYNLTLEREIVKDLAFEIGYVGSQSRHLGMRYNLNNAIPTGAVNTVTATNGRVSYTQVTQRMFPTLGEISYQVQDVNANYNALQTSLRRRSKNGLTLLVSYTFGKAMDQNSNTNNSTTGSQRNPQDITDFRAEWARADYHRAHQFSASFNYDLPFGKGKAFFSGANGVSQLLFGDWQINGIATILSGRPFTPVFSTADTTGGRPDIVGDPYANVPEGLMFDPFVFRRPVVSPSDPNLYGNSGRNVLTGPNFQSVDLSLFKNIRISEKARLQLRWEVFNVLNRPNYQLPVFLLPTNINDTYNATTGALIPAITLQELMQSTSVGRPQLTSNEAREMQFAMKIIF